MAKNIRVADLPGMRAFFDAVGMLLDAIAHTAGVPPEVEAAADGVRAEALGIGNEGPEVFPGDTPDDDARRRDTETHIRTAMNVARENPGRTVSVDDAGAVSVDWTPEP